MTAQVCYTPHDHRENTPLITTNNQTVGAHGEDEVYSSWAPRLPWRPEENDVSDVIRVTQWCHQGHIVMSSGSHSDVIRVTVMSSGSHSDVIRVTVMSSGSYSDVIRVTQWCHQGHIVMSSGSQWCHQGHIVMSSGSQWCHQGHSDVIRVTVTSSQESHKVTNLSFRVQTSREGLIKVLSRCKTWNSIWIQSIHHDDITTLCHAPVTHSMMTSPPSVTPQWPTAHPAASASCSSFIQYRLVFQAFGCSWSFEMKLLLTREIIYKEYNDSEVVKWWLWP